MTRNKILTVSGTSAATASTTILGTLGSLSQFDNLRFDAIIRGGTGGAMDLYIQRKLDTDVWFDWIRFPQVAAAGTKYYSVSTVIGAVAITEVGKWADVGTGTQVLAANTNIGGHPGDIIRVVAVAGASTSAGAVQTVYVTGMTRFT